MTNGWKQKIIENNDNMTPQWVRGNYYAERIFEYFCIFSCQEMSWLWWGWSVTNRRVLSGSHKNIPTPATFLAPETFYPNFIRRPNILNWGPSFQTERDTVAVSKSYLDRDTGVVERRYSLKTGHLKYLAVRTFSGAVFHITSRVIFYFLPRVMNTLDVIYRWNV